MNRVRALSFAVSFIALAASGQAMAGELKAAGTIAIPGEKLTSFDISFVDQATQMFAFADRDNKGVDLFDMTKDAYVNRVSGFIGIILKDNKPNTKLSGPNGVAIAGSEIWAGDGDSTLKIIDEKTLKVTSTISTGGKARLDEMAFDTKDGIFIGVNNADATPFATLISTAPDHHIIGKITFDDAADGAEQPQYNAADGMFYVSVPELKSDEKSGAIAVIDPKTAKIVKTLPVTTCHPTGLAFGPDGNFVLGCAGADSGTTIMSSKTGAAVAVIPGLPNADMVDYNAHNGQYYVVTRPKGSTPSLNVIDAKTNTLVQSLPLPGGGPHSVASSEVSGKVYVPVGTTDGGDGTIHVFAPK